MLPLRTLSRLYSCILLTYLVLAGAATPAAADELLVISNATDPARAEVRFSEADLLALPQVTIRTRTDYTDGVTEFVGPLARDAIASIGAGAATKVHLVAANDYAIDIPLSDFTDYDVILALRTNGERLTIRDKGPIWLMYPLDDHAELQDPMYNNRLIWQLTVIELR
ncbi:MAG: molybdopterin-dependent oxidoreductase [Proteobacteria bacterium]|nr:molybdopterin-dependent oxidoreductase [Pseudomonadota bacterium]MCH8951510.1 molybdopterin-dependent oxidoreductase [Pseudomonadota bacterium]